MAGGSKKKKKKNVPPVPTPKIRGCLSGAVCGGVGRRKGSKKRVKGPLKTSQSSALSAVMGGQDPKIGEPSSKKKLVLSVNGRETLWTGSSKHPTKWGANSSQ